MACPVLGHVEVRVAVLSRNHGSSLGPPTHQDEARFEVNRALALIAVKQLVVQVGGTRVHILAPTVLVTVLVTSVETLVVYDHTDDRADHRHQWADILVSLLESLVAQSDAFMKYATAWDSDSPETHPAANSSAVLDEVVTNKIPVASCPLRNLVDDTNWNPVGHDAMEVDAAWTPGAIERHPGRFLYPYFDVLDRAARYVPCH